MAAENTQKAKIEWGIVILTVLQQFFLPATQFLALSLLLIAVFGLWYFSDVSANLPGGMGAYLVWGIFAGLIGLINGNSFLYIARTASYWLNGAASMLLGVIIVIHTEKKENILRTLILIEFAETVYCFARLGLTGAYGSFNQIRSVLALNIVSLEFLFPLIIMKKYFRNEVFLHPVFDGIWVVLCSLRLLLCLSRTTIIGIMIGGILYFILLDRETKRSVSTVGKAVLILFTAFAAVLFFIFFMPDTVSSLFSGKMRNILNEIRISERINTYAGALSNWRAYENQEAMAQFLGYGILEKLWGEGFGALIHVQFMSSAWAGMEFYGSNGIPILHNSWFTVLCVGGIIGLVCFSRLFIKNIRYGMIRRRDPALNDCAVSFVVLYVMMAVNTYVIRGLFSPEMHLSWGILSSLYLYLTRREETEEEEEPEGENEIQPDPAKGTT